MGITPAVLRLLINHLPAESVLSLSYPDLNMTQDELEAIVGFRTDAVRHDGAALHHAKEPLPDTEEAMARLGAKSFRCVDIVRIRGNEEICDLNYEQDMGSHDLVLDCGTTEHCANFWQATVNASHAVKVGGVILHTPPLTMFNHGFVCPQPTFYHDLYTQNGWELLGIYATDNNNYARIEAVHRIKTLAPNLVLIVIARRLTDARMRYPVQYKYRGMIQ